ncbi:MULTISPECIES: hypothetical protein [unclassified Moraxella]|uniref:hypothetical protein n=1 Tax=unclassified Moraxella TaxID=2685852 RepID=UPI003AF5F5F2
MSDLSEDELLFSDDLDEDALEKLLAEMVDEPPTDTVSDDAPQIKPQTELAIEHEAPQRLTDEHLEQLLHKAKAVLNTVSSEPNNDEEVVTSPIVDAVLANPPTTDISDDETQPLASLSVEQHPTFTNSVMADSPMIATHKAFDKKLTMTTDDIKVATQGSQSMNQQPVNQEANTIKQQIAILQSQIHEMTGQFFSANEASAKLISQVRELQLANPTDFVMTYEQTQELRTKLVTARKQFLELTSLLDLVEEALESESYTKLTRPN